MSHDNAKHAGHSIKPYLYVFGALMVLTVLTVAVSHMPIPHKYTLAVGLTIATVKASLVALFFMHLKGERKLIWSLLGLCAIFVVVLFTLPWVDFQDNVALNRTQRDHVSSGNHGAAAEHGEEHDTHMSADPGKSPDKPSEPTKAEKPKAGKKKAEAHH